MDAVKGRLMDFLGHIGLDKSVFEREAGLANGFVDKTNSRMRKSSLNAISARFPQLNTDWLMTGQGEMLKDVPVSAVKEQDLVPQLLDRIDKLIEIHERDASNLERLLSIMMDNGVFEKTADKHTSSM